MPLVATLQEPLTVAANAVQEPLESIDVAQYKTLRLRLRRFVAGTGTAAIQFQHSMKQSEGNFSNVGATVSLVGTGYIELELTNTLRFLRWSVVNIGGQPEFMIEIIGRET